MTESAMVRKGIYTLEEVWNTLKEKMFLVNPKHPKGVYREMFFGDEIKANSQRYQLFFTKGIQCESCGIQGSFFAKEKHINDNRYHLNLYAINENGEEILMTKDHIIPKSKGGKSVLENYQVLCCRCNSRKGNRLEE